MSSIDRSTLVAMVGGERGVVNSEGGPYAPRVSRPLGNSQRNLGEGGRHLLQISASTFWGLLAGGLFWTFGTDFFFFRNRGVSSLPFNGESWRAAVTCY